MRGETWLCLWPSCVMLVLLLSSLGWPFGALRRWLKRGAYIGTRFDEENEERYAAIRGDQMLTEWVVSQREAARALRWWERLRNWLSELIDCPFCVGGHVTFWSVLIFAEGTVWDRVVWWGALWAATSFAVVTINRITEG